MTKNNFKYWFGFLVVVFAAVNGYGQDPAATKAVSQAMDHSEHMGHGQHMDHSEHADHSEHVDHSEHMDHSGHMDHSMHGGHHDHNMTLDDEGMVMNTNEDQLPQDCKQINREYEITVRAGIQYGEPFPGSVFGMDPHEIRVDPCSRISVTFINEDEVRHQWMVHQLPKYLYPQGMFHLEAAGGATKKGTFIVPSDDKTYLVHCDIAQHMEKGMKAQLVVGAGSGDLPSIPGVSQSWRQDMYPLGMNEWLVWGISFVACLSVLWLGSRKLF